MLMSAYSTTSWIFWTRRISRTQPIMIPTTVGTRTTTPMMRRSSLKVHCRGLFLRAWRLYSKHKGTLE